MSRIIFDIETAGKDFASLDEPTQQYLLKWAETKEAVQEVKESLSFYPVTAEIVAIGMLNPDTAQGAVYYQSPGQLLMPFEEQGVQFRSGNEADIIRWFWETMRSHDQFITFNGRSFDCPFIMIRSAVHRIRPSRDLMPNRYHNTHIDLLDQLTFFGAARRRFSLDMWCRAFGIRSPKADGITGYEVKDLFASGRHVDIARYCAGDLRATKELFTYWDKYIRFQGDK